MRSHINIFLSDGAEINKNLEYSNFIHTYSDADHAQDIYDRIIAGLVASYTSMSKNAMIFNTSPFY